MFLLRYRVLSGMAIRLGIAIVLGFSMQASAESVVEHLSDGGTRVTTTSSDASGKMVTTVATRDSDGRIYKWIDASRTLFLIYWDREGRIDRVDVQPEAQDEPGKVYLFSYDKTGNIEHAKVSGGEDIILQGVAAEWTMQEVLQQLLGRDFAL